MKTQVESVSPTKAAQWLATTNTHNRPISNKVAADYAKLMSEGLWEENGMPITFDVEGRLANGQHTLTAIVLSGVTVNCVIVRGVSVTAFETYDRPRKRTGADALHVAGYQVNTKGVEAAIRLANAYLLKKIGLRAVPKMSGREIVKFRETNPGIEKSVVDGHKLYHAGRILPPATISVSLFFTRQLSAEADGFWSSVVMGENLPANSAQLALHKFLVRERTTTGRNLDQAVLLASCIKAWNFHRAGKDCQYISTWKFGQEFPSFV